jgi:hypothetical protein
MSRDGNAVDGAAWTHLMDTQAAELSALARLAAVPKRD